LPCDRMHAANQDHALSLDHRDLNRPDTYRP
jgi:hypothetical protein